MRKFGAMLSVCLFVFLTGCANQQKVDNNLYGLWAMIPLNNGIANVVEFKKNGEETIYSFRCNWREKTHVATGVQEGTFVMKEGLIYVTEKGKEEPYSSLKINALAESSMELEQFFPDMPNDQSELRFKYERVQEVVPLCSRYY